MLYQISCYPFQDHMTKVYHTRIFRLRYFAYASICLLWVKDMKMKTSGTICLFLLVTIAGKILITIFLIN